MCKHRREAKKESLALGTTENYLKLEEAVQVLTVNLVLQIRNYSGRCV